MGGDTTHGKQSAAINRLLIVKMSSIGDVIHALPIASIIKRALPEIEIGWVVRQRCADLLSGNPDVDDVYVIPNRPNLIDLLRLRKRLRAKRYEIALDMQGLLLSGIVTWISGASRRIGLDLNREGNTLFMTEASVPGKFMRDRHAVDILKGFLVPLGIEDRSNWPVQNYLASGVTPLLPNNAKRIALNPGASSIYKQWPIANWAALAKRLIDSGMSVVVVGGPQDADAANRVEQEAAAGFKLINLAGKTTLTGLGAVLGACDALVTADTGPMHLSAAVGTPTIALFGPTNPKKTGPHGAKHHVIWKQLACAPCYRHPTCNGRIDCMNAITPDEVLIAVLESMKEKASC